MDLDGLATPAAVVDLDRLRRNVRAMAERAGRLGVHLRPHVKTHKTLEGARLQVAGQVGGITVSTLAEARFFAAGGFRDVTYAVPVAPSKLREVADLAARLDRLSVLVDHADAAAEVERCAAERGTRLSVWLKVDCGGHRAGVDPLRDESVALAARIARSRHLDFRGLLTHAAHAYACRNAGELRRVAREERDVPVAFARRLAAAGLAVPEVSIGSTPTMSVATELGGVTEVRPGNYVFFDAFQAAIGSCRLGECAFTVLVRVIGVYPARNELLVDGGALALSKDPGPVHVDPACGHGEVFDVGGRHHLAGLRVVGLSQEHGLLRARSGVELASIRIGTPLRIVPNHSCLAAALFESYHVVRRGRVIDEWRPVRGW